MCTHTLPFHRISSIIIFYNTHIIYISRTRNQPHVTFFNSDVLNSVGKTWLWYRDRTFAFDEISSVQRTRIMWFYSNQSKPSIRYIRASNTLFIFPRNKLSFYFVIPFSFLLLQTLKYVCDQKMEIILIKQ